MKRYPVISAGGWLMDNIKKALEKFPKSWPRFAWTIGTIIFTIFLCYYTIDLKSVNPKGMSIAKNAITGIFTPDIKIITDLSSVGLLYLLLETIAIAFLGTFIGVIFALPFAFLASRNIAPLWVNEIFLVIISIIRAFPAFMYGIMFVKAVGLGPFAGVLSMALGSLGMLSKLLIESIEDIDPGVIEALDSMGCSIFEKIRYGIIPQLSSNIISVILYRFDINIKNATILGLVGAGGIGAALIFAISAQKWHAVGAYLLGIVIMTLIVEWVSTNIRRRLSTGE